MGQCNCIRLPQNSYAAHNLKVFEFTNRLALSEDPNEKDTLLKEIAKLDRESEVKGDQVLREDVDKALEEKGSWKRIRELWVLNLQRLLHEFKSRNLFLVLQKEEIFILGLLKDLQPYFGEDTVRHALEFFIETKGQNVPPSREQEPSFSAAFVVRTSLIDSLLHHFGGYDYSDRFSIVFAGSGMGKTTFLINLYERYLKQGQRENGYQIKLFPLVYPGIDEELKKIVESGEDSNTILLLDGFDEDPKAIKDYKSRLDELVELIKNFRRIIITCRTQFFPSGEDLPGEINIPKPGVQKMGFHRFKLIYISPFDGNDISKYLDRRFPGRSNRKRRMKAQSIIERAPSLMVRPMLLSRIDDFLEYDNQSFESVSDIYAHLIDRWIQREASWKLENRRDTFKRELRSFSQQLALNLFDTWQTENRLHIKVEELDDFLNKVNFELSELEIRSQSLLNRDAEGNLKFAHKSIWEYLLAEQILEGQKSRGQIYGERSLVKQLRENIDGLDYAEMFFKEMGGVFPDEAIDEKSTQESYKSRRGFDLPISEENSPATVANNYFLGIGIDQYQHVGKLSNAVRDTRMISEVLSEKYGFEYQQLLFDKKATRLGILNVLREQIDRVGKEDNLVIYFSGHGHYDKWLRDAYWVPVDARFGDNTDYISYDFIRRSVAAMRARHIFLVVDSCYSGANMVSKRHESLQRFEKDPSRWMLASGRNEVVPDGISGGNSPFATQLLDVLTRYSGEGIRVSELVNKVTTAVIHDSYQTPVGRPLFQVGDKGGEFVFRAKLEEGSFWREVRRGNTVKGYEAYLLQFPTGRYREEAAWARAELIGTVEVYLDYRISYQGGKYYVEALRRIEGLEEDADWKYARRRNSIASYVGYKGKYPNGKYKEEAEKRIESLLSRKKQVSLQSENLRKEKLQAYLQEGKELFEEGDYESALECFQEALGLAKEEEKEEIEQAISRAEQELKKTMSKTHPLTTGTRNRNDLGRRRNLCDGVG